MIIIVTFMPIYPLHIPLPSQNCDVRLNFFRHLRHDLDIYEKLLYNYICIVVIF